MCQSWKSLFRAHCTSKEFNVKISWRGGELEVVVWSRDYFIVSYVLAAYRKLWIHRMKVVAFKVRVLIMLVGIDLLQVSWICGARISKDLLKLFFFGSGMCVTKTIYTTIHENGGLSKQLTSVSISILHPVCMENVCCSGNTCGFSGLKWVIQTFLWIQYIKTELIFYHWI